MSDAFLAALVAVMQRLAVVETTPPGQWADLGALERAWRHLGTLARTVAEQQEWTTLGEHIQAVNARRARAGEEERC